MAYLGITNAFELLRLLPGSDRDKDAEILTLRHQLAVLQRQLGEQRVRFDQPDRARLAALPHCLPKPTLHHLRLLVRPDAVLRWHTAPGQSGGPDGHRSGGPRIGSLCTGYGGLDLAVEWVLGGRLAWYAETDPHARTVLTHHWPDVANLGDIRTVDWNSVEPVDILTAGFPCQVYPE